MFASPALLWIFTIVFVVTGGYSLVRFALLASGAEEDGDRLVELSHLVMSVAMIAMTWGWSGGPSTAGGMLQLGIFGLLAVVFLAQVVAGDHDRPAAADHVLMNAAMVWMVAAMPTLMGMTMSAGSGAGGHDHSGHSSDGMDGMGDMGAAMAAAPVWVTVMNGVFIALLAGSVVFWAVRAVRAGTAEQPPASGAAAASGGGAAVAVRARSGLARVTNRRADAACHLLMSAGMAAMLLAMS